MKRMIPLASAFLMSLSMVVGFDHYLDARAMAQGTVVVPVPSTSWLLSPLTKYITTAASTNATLVVATPGNVYQYSLINTTATIYYLRMYNLAAAPTCSSATGFVETIPIPASTSGAGIQRMQELGQSFTTGIAFCVTGGGSSTDNTNAATGLYIAILYRGNS